MEDKLYVPTGKMEAFSSYTEMKKAHPWVAEEDAPDVPYRMMTRGEFEEYCQEIEAEADHDYEMEMIAEQEQAAYEAEMEAMAEAEAQAEAEAAAYYDEY